MTPLTGRRRILKIDSWKDLKQSLNLTTDKWIPDPWINLISRLNKLVWEETYSERWRTTKEKHKKSLHNYSNSDNKNLDSVAEHCEQESNFVSLKKQAKKSAMISNITKRRLNKIIYGV